MCHLVPTNLSRLVSRIGRVRDVTGAFFMTSNIHIFLLCFLSPRLQNPPFLSSRQLCAHIIHGHFIGSGTAIAMRLGLYSLSGKTSYRKISWSLEAARFGFKLFQSLWNLAGTSAALLPRCLSNFRAIRPLQHPISWLRYFTRFGGKTSYRLVNRGPELVS